MKNLLFNQIATAFQTVNKYGCNTEGGIALWKMPARFACAFNPIVFTRTRYYFQTAGYEPQQRRKPNYVVVSGLVGIRLAYKADRTVYVRVTTAAGIETIAVKAGDSTGTATATITAVNGLSYTATGPFSLVLRSDAFIYVREGYAYQDDDFICSDKGDVLYRVSDVDTSYLDIYTEQDEVGAKLSAECFDGVTQFDVSPVVRRWFASQLDDLYKPLTADKKLAVRYVVKGIGGTGTSYQFVAVNAVAHIGESSDLSYFWAEDAPLTEFKHLTYFPDYPLDYALLHEDQGTGEEWDVDGVLRVKVDGSEEHLWTESAAEGVLTETTDPILLLPKFNLPIRQTCAPAQPFYVRWINRFGGVDYFMFCRQQKRQPMVKSVDLFSTRVIDPYRARSNNYAYGMTTENKVTVGAEGLSDGDYNPLSMLPFSPCVEWYNEESHKWVALTVAKYDGAFDTRNNAHDFEVTFSLPEINTQF